MECSQKYTEMIWNALICIPWMDGQLTLYHQTIYKSAMYIAYVMQFSVAPFCII